MHAVKRRARRPCDACRRRKSRCEIAEGESICMLCKFYSQRCLFEDVPQPRKRKKLNEAEPNHTFETHSPSETASLEPIEQEQVSAPVRRVSVRQQLPVDDYANLSGPSLLKKTLGLQRSRHSNLIGSSAVYEERLLSQIQCDERDEISLGSFALRRVSDTKSFLLAADQSTPYHDDEGRDLDAIEAVVAPHGQALVNLYFRIVHPSYPILHKNVFLEKYARTHREFAPPLLAAVYILALNWWSYDVELATIPKPDVTKLEELASKTMNYTVLRPKLSTIQAGLLLLQRPEGDSWSLTSQLVGLAQDLGLHLDCSRWRVPPWERGLRRRLAWALYMQDKWGSLTHGRPSHITLADWSVAPVTEADFPERAADEDDQEGSTEVEKGRVIFCEMIRLTEILNLILQEFLTLSAGASFEMRAKEGCRWILEKARPIQIRLKDWFTQLPESLKMENVKARKLNSAGYLRLAYYATEITLHRQILRALAQEKDANLVTICRSAARDRLLTAVDFVRTLRHEHLQSFWFSASKYCFAIVGTFTGLLWITSQTNEEAEAYNKQLQEYKWLLRLSSKSAGIIERAIGLLNTSTVQLVDAIQDRSATWRAFPTNHSELNDIAKDEWSIEAPTFPEQETIDDSNHDLDRHVPQQPYLLEAGFPLAQFLDVPDGFDPPSLYQPHYGVFEGVS